MKNVEDGIKLDYSDVLIRPKRSTLSSRKDVSEFRQFKFVNSKREYDGIPIMAANMDGVGTFEMAEILAANAVFTCLTKIYTEDELITFFSHAIEHPSNVLDCVAISIGIKDSDFTKFKNVYEKTDRKIKYVCIDVANGYSQRFIEFVKNFRQEFSDITIIAGNIVTADQTQELILSGADIVKIGIGPGAMCTTRIQTGVGYPQLSAVMECAEAAHGLDGHIIADGGCACPGDVAKAFAGGADFVMLGSMIAGTDQGGGEIYEKTLSTGELFDDGDPMYITKKYIQFYGMSSETANSKHFGGLKDYRSSEGRTALIPYKGDVRNVLQDILGGLRSTMTYVGAKELKHLNKCTTFIMVNNQYNKSYENHTTGS